VPPRQQACHGHQPPKTPEPTLLVDGLQSNDGLSEATAVQSQASIPASCTEVYYARGSVFNEAVSIGGFGSTRTVFASYGDPGLPKPAFIVPHTTNSGPLVSAYQGGITLDGLYLEGSKGDGTMEGLGQGVCVTIGGGSQVLNCEITNCDIGMMLHGEGSLVQGNYFHDMTLAVDAPQGSVDPNLVGGGNGIFIHGSNNEVAYNSFVRCADYAEWTESPCDGCATEITVGSGATITGVRVHHDFSYESCGFLEIATVAGETGYFVDSEFHHNVHVDGGWLMLLQVNNTEMSNVSFTNNTVVQRPESYNAGMVVTVFDGFSSGTEGGTLDPGEVSMTNNLIVFDGVTSWGDVVPEAIAQLGTLIIETSSQDPGFVNLAGTTAGDFDLVEGSPAIDAGEATSYTVDYADRPVPAGGATDVGAFEYQGGALPVPEGVYELQNVGSGKCLEVASASVDNGANIEQRECSHASNQQWQLVARPDGSYRFEAMHSSKCMVALGKPAGDGDNIQQGRCVYQRLKWQLLEAAEGQYELVSKKSGLCADIAGAPSADGANAEQWQCSDADTQRFVLVEVTTESGSGASFSQADKLVDEVGSSKGADAKEDSLDAVAPSCSTRHGAPGSASPVWVLLALLSLGLRRRPPTVKRSARRAKEQRLTVLAKQG
jgi:hypothetical protein